MPQNAAPAKRLFLIDAHSHLHRAYHAIAGLTNSKGFPTNALFGFLTILNRLLKTYDPHYIAVVFDSPGPTFRQDEYADYKANRPPMPDDLRVQVDKIKEIVDALGLARFEAPRFEADDIIATLARKAAESQTETWIVSVDKDLFQLIGPYVKMLRHHLDKEELVDVDAVVKRLGVRPEQVADYLGLIGDSSDNIPGVPGVGPKTAVQLLQQFGDLDTLLARVDEVEKTRWRALIVEHVEKARLSRQLALVRYDVPVEFSLDNLVRKSGQTAKLQAIYRDLEFNSLLQDLGGVSLEGRTVDYKSIRTEDELRQFATEIRSAGRVALDTETTHLDPFEAQLVGISASLRRNHARYIPVGHDPEAAEGPQLPLDAIRALLGPVLADPEIRKVFQNYHFDYKILKRAGFQIEGVTFDTMLASYLLNPDKRGHGLKAMALEHLGVEMTHIEHLIGDGSFLTMANVAVSETEPYACQDADLTLQLSDFFAPQLKDADLVSVLEDIEVPLMPVLADMEMAGVRIDAAHFNRLRIETESQIRDIERQAHEAAGHPFNLGSPKQVAQILFEELKLPTQRKGKTGYSTDVDVLEQLERETQNPLPRLLLEYRGADKLLNTYIVALPKLVHSMTGRIHTSFNQTVAATGRLSSSDPNLQNIPVRTAAGRQIRQGFIPSSPSHVFLSADYSQIELRILAHMSGDESLQEAFRQGQDVHRATASRVFGVAPESVTDTMRDQAKTVNFGVIYGISAHGLSNQLRITHKEAQKFIDDYFVAYPGVKRFIDETIAEARKTGFVRTMKGRRRLVADLGSRNPQVRGFAERIAVNTPIQGTSADMIKIAMIALHRRLAREGFRAAMILQVHDELIFDTPESEVDRLKKAVGEEMEGALPLNVPVRVDIYTGRNWAEC